MVPEVWTITGTDTSVGKTVLTLHLLAFLQHQGIDVRAFKPFASGDRSDAELLGVMQKDLLSLDQINPCFFPLPLAPYAVTESSKRIVPKALKSIQKSTAEASGVLLEGIGGLMTPLSRRETWLDFAVAAKGKVIVVGPNRLGVLNHILLTVQALKRHGLNRFRIALVEPSASDLAGRCNFRILKMLLGNSRVIQCPFFGTSATEIPSIRARVRQFKPVFAGLLR